MEIENKSRCENCIIKRLNALKALSKEELKSISNCRVIKTLKKGEVIFSEGEKLNGVYCVRKGISKLSKGGDNGRDHIVKITDKNQVLGLRSIIAKEKTNLSAIALENMEVCFIPKPLILEYLSNNQDFTLSTLEHMAIDLKFAENALVNMAQKNVPQRLAEALIYVKNNFGTDTEGFLNLILKREDFANLIGTSKEVCIRTLTIFKKEKWILTRGKSIKIENEKALLKLVKGS